MSANLLLGDMEKAFLQIRVKGEDRDSFRFLFNVRGVEKHLRFTRVPFGVEASPNLEQLCNITLNSKGQSLKTQ